MYIKKLSAKNFRTLENFSTEFNGYYIAISGKNNAGKSNLLRVIRMILNAPMPFIKIGRGAFFQSTDWKDDITGWKEDSKEDIELTIQFVITKTDDCEIYKYIQDFIINDKKEMFSASNDFEIEFCYSQKCNNDCFYKLSINNILLEDNKAKEFRRRITSSDCINYYNSTSKYSFFDESDRISDFLSPNNLIEIQKKKDELLKVFRKSLKAHEADLTKMLGSLEDKYTVSLSMQGLDFEKESIDISLKEKNCDVPLDHWGSGTKNRTLIFLKIFNTLKRCNANTPEDNRLKPVLIVEEPECFLHPHAQAEFGQILQHLANENKIQVVVTTHSPYFLSFSHPSSNILLGRKKSGESYQIETNGEFWYEPFVSTLGIDKDNYGPMKEVIFNENNKLLLVEGELDKKYLNFLKSDIHGDNALNNEIEIHPMGGVDALKNNVWMNFIKNKFKKVVVLVDLDRSNDVKKSLQPIGFKENNNLYVVGSEESPYIEDLVPNDIFNEITSNNPDITRKLMSADKKKKDSGRSELKSKLADALIARGIGSDLSKFYELTRKLNKSFK